MHVHPALLRRPALSPLTAPLHRRAPSIPHDVWAMIYLVPPFGESARHSTGTRCGNIRGGVHFRIWHLCASGRGRHPRFASRTRLERRSPTGGPVAWVRIRWSHAPAIKGRPGRAARKEQCVLSRRARLSMRRWWQSCPSVPMGVRSAAGSRRGLNPSMAPIHVATGPALSRACVVPPPLLAAASGKRLQWCASTLLLPAASCACVCVRTDPTCQYGAAVPSTPVTSALLLPGELASLARARASEPPFYYY
ncbi:hypothetical protein ZWY2020_013641 [Hordeum vulgare]|nr:hypothetical protein ZWY2020_013641 [Hordeum vulgare]